MEFTVNISMVEAVFILAGAGLVVRLIIWYANVNPDRKMCQSVRRNHLRFTPCLKTFRPARVNRSKSVATQGRQSSGSGRKGPRHRFVKLTV